MQLPKKVDTRWMEDALNRKMCIERFWMKVVFVFFHFSPVTVIAKVSFPMVSLCFNTLNSH